MVYAEKNKLFYVNCQYFNKKMCMSEFYKIMVSEKSIVNVLQLYNLLLGDS